MPSARSDHELAAFFDRCAHKRLMTDFPGEELAKLEGFLELWDIKPGARILEPGCGSGRLTEVLARAAGPEGEVYACDVSGEMLRLARERFGEGERFQQGEHFREGEHVQESDGPLPPGVHFALESALAIQRPAAWFDRVICMNVFPHFSEPEKALREFARLLKPGGALWINHFEGRDSLNRFHHEAAPEVSDHVLPCPYTMRRLMDAAGLQIETLEDRPEGYWLKATLTI